MSAPPDPPDPRERLRRDGGPEAFEARGGPVLALGGVCLLLGASGLAMAALGAESHRGVPPAVMALLAAGLLVMGAGYVLSPRLVRRIVIDKGVLCFRPVGVEVPLAELVGMEPGLPDAAGQIARLRLRLRTQPRLVWLPGRLAWAGRRLDIWLIGMDGAALHAALADCLERPPS